MRRGTPCTAHSPYHHACFTHALTYLRECTLAISFVRLIARPLAFGNVELREELGACFCSPLSALFVSSFSCPSALEVPPWRTACCHCDDDASCITDEE